MKTEPIYDCATGATVEMATADVAQGLYDALEDAKKEMEHMRNEIGHRLITLSVIEVCESALATADGEAQ